MDVVSIFTSLSLQEAYNLLQPLVIFIIGMVIYAVFIFKIYMFVATRDLFEKRKKYKQFKEGIKARTNYTGGKKLGLHVLEYIFFYPFMLFFFFVFFFLLLAFLSRSADIGSMLLISMAMVGSIRVTSYYKENLSRDLAKMLPFALLGIMLVDISFFSFSTSLEVVKTALLTESTITILIYYLLFIILIEFVLRIIHFIYTTIKGPRGLETVQ